MFFVKKVKKIIKKKIILIICARCSSKRFPNKVLKKINGKELLLQVYDRVKYSECINRIIVATSKKRSDDNLEKLCKKNNIKCYRGSLNNVFSRFRNIINIYDPDILVRISADSPFIDPKLIDQSIKLFLTKRVDIVTNVFKRTYPKGQSIEVFNKQIFLKPKNLKLNSYEKEHVSPFFYKNKKKYKIFNFESKNNLSKYNLTVDYKNDLIFFNKIIKKIKVSRINYSYKTILKLIKKHEN